MLFSDLVVNLADVSKCMAEMIKFAEMSKWVMRVESRE